MYGTYFIVNPELLQTPRGQSSVSTRDWLQDPCGYHSLGMSSPIYNMASYLHVTYAHPPLYFKPSPDYLYCLIRCKCYVNSCQHMANSSFAFWNVMDFFLNTSGPGLAESTDADPRDKRANCLLNNLRQKLLEMQGVSNIYFCP